MKTFTSDINQLVTILRKDGDMQPMTMIEFFNKTVKNFPDRDALAYRDSNGIWHKINFKEYKIRVEKVAKVFIKLGLKQRGVVAILAWNSPEWVISALAAIHAGGVITGIYTTNSPDACQYVLENSKTQIVIVDEENQLEKINQIKENLPDLISVIETSKFSELLETLIPDEIEVEYQRRKSEIVPNQCCAIIYTSGTTGFPRGAMMSHDNLIWQSVTSATVMGVFDGPESSNEAIISYLPLSHLAAFEADIVSAIHLGATVYFTDPSALKGSLLQYLKESRPTAFFSVPRMYEKIEEKFKVKVSDMNIFKRKFFTWSSNLILGHYQAIQRNENPTSSFMLAIARKYISDPIKEALGLDRCKVFITGSAPMSEETKNFFMSLEMPLLDGYGLTESSTVHTLQSLKCRFGSVGKEIPGAETKLVNKNEKEEGEICMKGRHVFMGYLNDHEKTREAFDDEGWLHSGDVGFIDDEGFLFIRGRIKEIIITSGGENIPSAFLENNVKILCPAISNAFLVGDKRKYLTMLLTFKTENNSFGNPKDELSIESLTWLKSKNINCKNLSELLDDENLNHVLQEVVDKVNSKAISNAQKIQKFSVLPHDFSIVTGELTPTLKVKRHVVVEKYKNTIEKLYT